MDKNTLFSMTIRWLFCAVKILMFSVISAYAVEKPKVISLDYCADQFILSLADQEQVMALTNEAIQGHSFYKAKAKDFPLFRVSTEAVLNMKPDIVVRNWGGYRMLDILSRTNISVISAQYGTGPETLYQNMRYIGQALHQETRAEGLIKNHQLRLKKLTAKVDTFKQKNNPIRVAYIAPGGVTAGKDTFVNGIIKMAGLTSLSEEQGMVGWQNLPVEFLIQNPPDVIIGSFFDLKNIHRSNWSLSRHDRIKNMIATIPTIMVPGRYLSCNGIFSVDAAEYIQEKLGLLNIQNTREATP